MATPDTSPIEVTLLDYAHDDMTRVAGLAALTGDLPARRMFGQMADVLDCLRRLDIPTCSNRHRAQMATELVQAAIALHATTLQMHAGWLDPEANTNAADIDGLAGLHQLIADVISEQQWRYAEHRPVPHIAATETATAAKRLTWLATHLDSIATDRTEP
jgi:hypothetical protein